MREGMEPIARVDRRHLEFVDGTPIVRLEGPPEAAARELDEVWLPLLLTGHRNVIVTLDRLHSVDDTLLAALGRVLRHVRASRGDMVLVATRPEIVRPLQEWKVSPAVPILPDPETALLMFQEREAFTPLS